jgi:hypothetical protein
MQEKDFDELLEQMRGVRTDKDRVCTLRLPLELQITRTRR